MNKIQNAPGRYGPGAFYLCAYEGLILRLPNLG
jgi:hypothetical protein